MSERKMRHITRGARKYVKQAINETGSDNIYDICEQLSSTLEDTFSGDTLDYQLREDRMDLATTGKIMDAIETYMYNYLSEDDKKRIEEGHKHKEKVRNYAIEKGVNINNMKIYTPETAAVFTKAMEQAEKRIINLTTSEEEKAAMWNDLDNAINQLKEIF